MDLKKVYAIMRDICRLKRECDGVNQSSLLSTLTLASADDERDPVVVYLQTSNPSCSCTS